MDSTPVPSGRIIAASEDHRVTKEEFVAWQDHGTDAEVAVFFNNILGSKYEAAVVWKWRTGARPVPARVSEIVLTHPKPKWIGSNKPKWAHGVEKPTAKKRAKS